MKISAEVILWTLAALQFLRACGVFGQELHGWPLGQAVIGLMLAIPAAIFTWLRLRRDQPLASSKSKPLRMPRVRGDKP